MARFFFNFFDGESLIEDDTGVNLDTVELAYLEASATAAQMWPDLIADRISPIHCAFDIANEGGEVLLRFEFIEVADFGRNSVTRPGASLEILLGTIADTHRHTRQAQLDLDASIAAVREAITEVRSLLDQL